MGLIINRAFVCVLLLSVSGFVCSGIYLLLEKFIYRLTSAKMMVRINTLVLFSFVIPFYFPVSILDGSESCFMHYDLVVFDGQDLYSGFTASVRNGFPCIQWLDTLWFAGFLIFFASRIIRYLYTMAMIAHRSFAIESDVWLHAFENVRGEQKKQNVLLVGSNDTCTPFTAGIRRKYIVIPTNMINTLNEEEIEFILRHEYCHTLRNDVCRKIIMFFLGCLNWFHPLYHLLQENLSVWMEIACDETATMNFDKRQRKKYAGLIIKVLSLENMTKEKHCYCICYSGDYIKNYKRRILGVLQENKRKGTLGKAFVLALTICSLIFGNMIAKEADVSVNMLFSDNVVIYDLNDPHITFEVIER